MPFDDLALFLDTNTLLHYPPIKDVAWKSVGGCSSVRLIFCLQVIHELDEKKDDPGLGDRSSRTIKEIKMIRSASGAVREGVTLEVFNYEIRVTDFPTTLSYDSKDDRIVHSVKKYLEEHPDSRVAVYTEDMGMSLRCEANGIPVLEPDKTTRMENPQDELTKKYKATVYELNALKNRLPDLAVLVLQPDELPKPDETPLFKATLESSWTDLDIGVEMEKVRRNNPPADLRQHHVRQFQPSNNELASYNSCRDSFFHHHESFLRSLNAWGRKNELVLHFNLWLLNVGHAPAEDVDVVFRLISTLQEVVILGSDNAKPFRRPSPPAAPKIPWMEIPTLSSPTSLDLGMEPAVPPSAERIDRVQVTFDAQKGWHIEANVRKLKHGAYQQIGSFLAVFGCWEDVKPFDATYSIAASELPKKKNGKIPFIVRAETIK